MLLDYPTIHPVLLQLFLHRSAHNVITLLYEKHRFELVHKLKYDSELRFQVDSQVGNEIEVYS